MEVTEIQESIKRLYLSDFDFTILRGQTGEEKAEALRIYLNNEAELEIEEILDIVRCEKRFGYYIYYKD